MRKISRVSQYARKLANFGKCKIFIFSGILDVSQKKVIIYWKEISKKIRLYGQINTETGRVREKRRREKKRIKRKNFHGRKKTVVVQSTFPTQREHHTPQCRTISGSLRCYKNKRRCLASLMRLNMSRKHMPLSNKIHFEVKIWKHARFQFSRFKCFVSTTH